MGLGGESFLFPNSEKRNSPCLFAEYQPVSCPISWSPCGLKEDFVEGKKIKNKTSKC